MAKQYLTFSLAEFEMSRIASRLWPVSSVHKSQALKKWGKKMPFFPRALHRKDVSKNNADRIKNQATDLLFTQADAIKTEDCVHSVQLVPLPEKCMVKKSFTLPM